MIRTTIFCLLSTALLIACGGETDKNLNDRIKSRQDEKADLNARIDSLENVVYQEDYDMSAPATAMLIKDYNRYAELFIGDKEKAPEYLYKVAALSRAVKLPSKALKVYDKILTDYPGYERNPEVAFLMAFTYDEDLKEVELAREAYQEVIEKYPGDMWAKQAEERLKTLGMSDDELIKSFMEKNKPA